MTGSLFQERFFAASSFCDLAPPNESHMRENYGKNTAGPNEHAGFEQSGLEHTNPPKPILAMTWPNHPGDGITLRQNRSTSNFSNLFRRMTDLLFL